MCDVFNSIYEQVGPKCSFFQWIDNPTCIRVNEAAHLVQQKLNLLRSELQLAHERERVATQIAVEATQMVEIALDRTAKATKKERKFRALYSSQGDSSESFRAREKVQNCTNSVMVFYFFIFYFLLYCFHVLT